MKGPSAFAPSASQVGNVSCCLSGIPEGGDFGMGQENPSLVFKEAPQPTQEITPALGAGCWLPVSSCAS